MTRTILNFFLQTDKQDRTSERVQRREDKEGATRGGTLAFKAAGLLFRYLNPM